MGRLRVGRGVGRKDIRFLDTIIPGGQLMQVMLLHKDLHVIFI